jgi:hypothetical protein
VVAKKTPNNQLANNASAALNTNVLVHVKHVLVQKKVVKAVYALKKPVANVQHVLAKIVRVKIAKIVKNVAKVKAAKVAFVRLNCKKMRPNLKLGRSFLTA